MGNKAGKVQKPGFRQNSSLENVKGDSELGKRLKAIKLLENYKESELTKLAGLLKYETHPVGKCIIKQGEKGKGFYIIEEGACEVVREDNGTAKTIASLKAGEYFGEFALINNAARGASVKTLVETKTFFLNRQDFQTLFDTQSLTFSHKRVAVSAGLDQGSYTPPAGAKKDKTASQVALILESIKQSPLFLGLDTDVQKQVVAEMHQEEIPAGQECIKQGEQGVLFYVVEEGEFDILVNNKVVALYGVKTCFGDLALMYNAPRAATVKAKVTSKVWVMHRHVFRQTVQKVTSAAIEKNSGFLESVPLLKQLTASQRTKVADVMEKVKFSPGQVIFEQGAEGTALYIIQSGEVAIFKDGEQVMTCGPGDYFGERALLKKEVRAASPKAVTDVVLLQIAKRDFDAYLGPLESTLQSTVKTYDEQNSRRSAPTPTPAGAKKEAWTKIPFEELEPIGTLGKGSFGYVRLMKHAKHPDQTFALKAVSKAVIVETGQQGHIMSEKKVMEELRHPFLIRLYQTYKDEHRLYFLLEPVLGGELFTLLRREALFDDHTSQFYAGCVVLAFECMHSLDIIYRDLKPENLLIDADGYIKVTDFGFAKRVDTAKTWTLCGTPDYLAPELVGGKGHNKGVDWWTLGILIWEMLAGQPPYYDDDQMRTYKKIVSDEPLQFPAENFTDEAKSILRKLLKKKPTQRLGVVKGGASLVKKHRWFNDLGKNAWTNLVNKEIPAPSKPDISDSSDLNNFEEVEEDDAVEPYIDDGTGWDAAF